MTHHSAALQAGSQDLPQQPAGVLAPQATETTRRCLRSGTYPVLGGLTTLLEPAIPPCSTWVSAMFKGRLLQPFAQMKAGIGVKKAAGRFGWPNPSQSLPGGTSDGQRLT